MNSRSFGFSNGAIAAVGCDSGAQPAPPGTLPMTLPPPKDPPVPFPRSPLVSFAARRCSEDQQTCSLSQAAAGKPSRQRLAALLVLEYLQFYGVRVEDCSLPGPLLEAYRTHVDSNSTYDQLRPCVAHDLGLILGPRSELPAGLRQSAPRASAPAPESGCPADDQSLLEHIVSSYMNDNPPSTSASSNSVDPSDAADKSEGEEQFQPQKQSSKPPQSTTPPPLSIAASRTPTPSTSSTSLKPARACTSPAPMSLTSGSVV
eukprot:RCo030296